MSATAKKTIVSVITVIDNDEQKFEAAGFVLDCIIADGACDDPLGDSASLEPIQIARAEDGSIQAVLCKVKPHGLKVDDLVGQQVLISAT